jgi:hypothetical protein
MTDGISAHIDLISVPWLMTASGPSATPSGG